MIQKIDSKVVEAFRANYTLSNNTPEWDLSVFSTELAGKNPSDHLVMECCEITSGHLDLVMHFESAPSTFFMIEGSHINIVQQSDYDAYISAFRANLYRKFNVILPDNTKAFSLQVFQANVFCSLPPAPYNKVVTHYALVDLSDPAYLDCNDPVTKNYFAPLDRRVVKMVSVQDASGNSWMNPDGSVVYYDTDHLCPPHCH